MWSQGKCEIRLNKVCDEKFGNKNDDVHDLKIFFHAYIKTHNIITQYSNYKNNVI